MAHHTGFFSLPGEERNEIYILILREQPESGATLTISLGGTETYQFKIPQQYFGLLAANKQAYQEFSTLAARVYTADDFENEKGEAFVASGKLKRPLQVKKIVFNHALNVKDPAAAAFKLTLPAPMTDLMRWSTLSIYLRGVECHLNIIDFNSNAFIAKFTFSLEDFVSDSLAHTNGLFVWTLAMGQLEADVRKLVFRAGTQVNDYPYKPSKSSHYCKWLENQSAGVASGDEKLIYMVQPGFTLLGNTWHSIAVDPKT